MNRELPDMQARLRKGTGTKDQIASIPWVIGKNKGIPEKYLLCFIDYAKAFDYVDQNKLWEILRKIGITNHLTCLLQNLYAGQGS